MLKISPQHVDPMATEVCRILSQAGYQAYIVGGCVRDLLLNVKPKDWDICTDASPDEVMRIFPKTYPTGLQHGTVTVSMGDSKELHYEVTTFRTEGEYSDGRRPDSVQFVKNVEEDLLRRDFTINAIAYDPINDKLVDPFNGQQDLEFKVLRAVGHAVERFTEDGLRIMRAARFAARLNYTIEHTTLTGMAVCSYMLESISKERIKDELCKILQTANPEVGLRILHNVDALEFVIPYLQKTEHEMLMDFKAINKCGGSYETKMAILMFDQGSISSIESTLKIMTFSNDEIKRVLFVLNTLHVFERIYDEHYLDGSLPAWKMRKGLAFIKNNSPYGYSEGLNEFIKFIEAIKLGGMLGDISQSQNELVWGRNELKISGKDLMELGVKQGPEFKRLLDLAYEEILMFPENNTNEYLRKFVQDK